MIISNLWNRKTRTVLTILGIAMGVAAVVSLSALGEGMASGMEEIFTSSDADLMVAQKDAMMVLFSKVDESIAADIERIPGVVEVTGTVINIVQMDTVPYFIVTGEDTRGFGMAHYRIIAGGPILQRKQILIGKLAAESFDKDVGEAFRLEGSTYRVVGIYETGTSFEDGGAVMSLSDAQRLFDQRYQVSYFNLRVNDKTRIDAIRNEIENRWPKLAATRSGEQTRQTEMLGMYRSFGFYMGIFAVLVGGLGMMNSTLMSVFERTREIGVLRAIGWRRRRVIVMILGESLIVALLGGVVGVGVGYGLTEAIKLSPAVSSMLSGAYTIDIFVRALGLSIGLGILSGLYPAWRASKLLPAEAMRAATNLPVSTSSMELISRILSNSALRNLWRRPTRTFVTLISIGLGVGFTFALMGMTSGMESMFTNYMSSGDSDLMVEEKDAADASLSVISERTANSIRAHPEVRSVSRIVWGITTAPGLPFFMVNGLDPRESKINDYNVREGRTLQRSGEVILGRLAANSLKKDLDDKMRIAGARFTIVGIYENGVSFEDTGAAISLRDAQNLFDKKGEVSFLGVALHDQKRAVDVANMLEQQFADVMVGTTSTFTEKMQDFKTMESMMNAMSGLTMLVGGIVMMNAMLMSVFERTQEIGLLRAVGWKRKRVVGMIVIEGLALSLFSGVAGVGIGIGLNSILGLIPLYGSFFNPIYEGPTFLQIGVLVLVLGVVGSIYPAWKAASLKPIEALRYE
ncbi:MAG TPA: FtsX-like permease family protein [Anaerolineales bacterium]|nr:FtsX-like permease family protein [Anaerolineales bacterium]